MTRRPEVDGAVAGVLATATAGAVATDDASAARTPLEDANNETASQHAEVKRRNLISPSARGTSGEP